MNELKNRTKPDINLTYGKLQPHVFKGDKFLFIKSLQAMQKSIRCF